MRLRPLAILSWAAALVAACVPSPPAPNTPQATQDILSLLEPTQLVGRTDTFLVRNKGDSVRADVVVYIAGSDSVIDSIKSLGQQAVVVFDLHSRSNTTVTDSFGQEIVHLHYVGNEMRGLRVAIDSTGHRDSVHLSDQLPPGTVDRRSLALVLQLVPLRDGATFSIPLFDSWSQHVVTAWVAVDGPTWRRVRAGTITVYRIDVRGDSYILPRVFYVTADVPRRIILMEMSTTSWELVNHRLQ